MTLSTLQLHFHHLKHSNLCILSSPQQSNSCCYCLPPIKRNYAKSHNSILFNSSLASFQPQHGWIISAVVASNVNTEAVSSQVMLLLVPPSVLPTTFDDASVSSFNNTDRSTTWKEAPRPLFSLLLDSAFFLFLLPFSTIVVVVVFCLRMESNARGAAVARRLTGLRMVVVVVLCYNIFCLLCI